MSESKLIWDRLIRKILGSLVCLIPLTIFAQTARPSPSLLLSFGSLGAGPVTSRCSCSGEMIPGAQFTHPAYLKRSLSDVSQLMRFLNVPQCEANKNVQCEMYCTRALKTIAQRCFFMNVMPNEVQLQSSATPCDDTHKSPDPAPIVVPEVDPKHWPDYTQWPAYKEVRVLAQSIFESKNPRAIGQAKRLLAGLGLATLVLFVLTSGASLVGLPLKLTLATAGLWVIIQTENILPPQGVTPPVSISQREFQVNPVWVKAGDSIRFSLSDQWVEVESGMEGTSCKLDLKNIEKFNFKQCM